MIEKGTQSAGLKVEDRILTEVRTLESWYSNEFERRLSELARLLNSQLEYKIQEVRAQYQQQYEVLQQQASQTRQPAAAPAQSLTTSQNSAPSRELLEELARVEISVQKCTADLERMVADDGIPMGKLLQLRNHEVELKAYMRGLKFNATSAAVSPKPTETSK